MSNTLKPLDPPFPDNIAAILDHYPQSSGNILSLFRTFANSERFLKKGVPNLLDKGSPLDLRVREIVILRVTANRNCEYEWGVHVAIFSKVAGLSHAEVTATRLGTATSWSKRESRLIATIDALCETGSLDDTPLSDFQSDWSTEEQLEIMALIGAYSTISFVANVARLPPESFAVSFPTEP